MSLLLLLLLFTTTVCNYVICNVISECICEVAGWPWTLDICACNECMHAARTIPKMPFHFQLCKIKEQPRPPRPEAALGQSHANAAADKCRKSASVWQVGRVKSLVDWQLTVDWSSRLSDFYSAPLLDSSTARL